MSIYCIADLHLSLSGNKGMDVFQGWENYVEKLETNWKSVVKGEDTVVIAGDISWAMRLKDSYEDFKFLDSLPGKKIIIRGNHDYWWATASKIKNFFAENKFDSLSILFNSAIKCEGKWICGTRGWMNDPDEEADKKILLREIQRLRTSLDSAEDDGCEKIVFLHYPPVYSSGECEEIINIMIERNIKKCYYGHIHGCEATKRAIKGDYKGINFDLISCDYLNFTPKLVDLK